MAELAAAKFTPKKLTRYAADDGQDIGAITRTPALTAGFVGRHSATRCGEQAEAVHQKTEA